MIPVPASDPASICKNWLLSTSLCCQTAFYLFTSIAKNAAFSANSAAQSAAEFGTYLESPAPVDELVI